MALMRCPECGRDSVSDSATMCPGCGYNLKVHFDEIRKREKEEKAEAERAQRIKAAFQKNDQNVSEEERRKRILKSLEEKRIAKKKEVTTFIAGITVFALGLVVLFCMCIALPGLNMRLPALICIGMIVLFSALAHSAHGEYQQIVADIETASNNLDEYGKILGDRLRQKVAELKASTKAIARENELKHPICPNCGGRDTQRISSANRATSVALAGLASSKIGKQYECKKCKHKW